jgi:nickel/cobalt transporter (NicO) family protein
VTAVGDGVRLTGTNVPTTSSSDELRAYPVDMLSSPLHVSSMSASFVVTGPALGTVAPFNTSAGTGTRPAT